MTEKVNKTLHVAGSGSKHASSDSAARRLHPCKCRIIESGWGLIPVYIPGRIQLTMMAIEAGVANVFTGRQKNIR